MRSFFVNNAVAVATFYERTKRICRGAEHCTNTYGGAYIVGPSQSAALLIIYIFSDHDFFGSDVKWQLPFDIYIFFYKQIAGVMDGTFLSVD